MKRKNKIITIIVLLALLLSYLSFRTYKFSKSVSSFNGIVGSIPPDYINLFDSVTQVKLLAGYTQLSKVREPNSILDYKEYRILIYKVRIDKKSFSDLNINKETGNISSSENALYMEALAAPFKIDINTDSISEISNVFIKTASDSSISVIANDTTFGFYTFTNEFSIRFGKDAPVDMFALAKHKIPCDFLFVIKNQFLYFLVMMPDDPISGMRPGLLYSTIKK